MRNASGTDVLILLGGFDGGGTYAFGGVGFLGRLDVALEIGYASGSECGECPSFGWSGTMNVGLARDEVRNGKLD